MEMKKNDKSLIMYTSLIFVAAIIMIVVSFFAQRHLEQMRVSETQAENVTLSNKAAQVSEENMQLVAHNKTLKDENKRLADENQVLALNNEELKKENAGFKDLIEVYDLLLEDNESAAEKRLKKIFTEDLSPEQKEIYDFLVKELQ